MAVPSKAYQLSMVTVALTSSCTGNAVRRAMDRNVIPLKNWLNITLPSKSASPSNRTTCCPLVLAKQERIFKRYRENSFLSSNWWAWNCTRNIKYQVGWFDPINLPDELRQVGGKSLSDSR